MAAGAAFRYFIGGFSPSYASQTIHPETVNKHLTELSTEINTAITAKLRARHDSVTKTVGAISCTTMTLFTKCYTPPLGTRITNTVPALKTTTVNRPVPALKKKHPSRHKQKIQPPGPGAEKTQPPRPVPPRKKNSNRPVPPRKKIPTAPSHVGKKIQPPRPASGKKNDRPVPPRKKNNRPVPPRKTKTTVPSRQEFCLEKYRPVPSRQEFPPLYFASPALPPK